MNEIVDRATAAVIALLEAGDGMPYASRMEGTNIMVLDGNFDIEEIVRATIAAIREPTEAMVEAAKDADEPGSSIFGDPHVSASHDDAWRAMIDKALE